MKRFKTYNHKMIKILSIVNIEIIKKIKNWFKKIMRMNKIEIRNKNKQSWNLINKNSLQNKKNYYILTVNNIYENRNLTQKANLN